ncbi:hypothetical protein ABBQ32_011516 [Trebouxia sp. C0010 RCD-2024]
MLPPPVASAMESPLLQLQVDALLSETGLTPEEVTAYEETLSKLSEVLLQLPDTQVDPAQAAAYLASLGISSMRPSPFPFHAPSHVSTTGSAALQCLAKPDTMVDVAVTIPKACLYEKDHLDCKYHGKRVLWLAVVAFWLKKHAMFKQQEKPCLILKPQPAAACSIRLIPTLPPDVLPLARLAPERNSLRMATAGAMPATAAAAKPGNTAKGQKRKRGDAEVHNPVSQEGGTPAGKGGSVEAPRLPTPHYNTSIIIDLVVEQHQQVLQSAFDAVPRLREAIVLLKVWMRRQHLSGQPDGFNGFLMSMLAAHLVQQSRLNHAMSHVQLLRAIFHALADPKTLSQGIFMQWDNPQSSQKAIAPSQQAMRKAFEVVFVDSSGWCNLAAYVSKSALKQMQACAKRSVVLLDQAAAGQHTFDVLFLTSHSPVTTYDYLFHVHIPQKLQVQLHAADSTPWQHAETKLEALMKQALGPRATLVHAHRRQPLASAPKKGGLKPPQGDILVGVNVDSAAALQLRDMGPPADDVQAAAKFRQFWGEKAELRRFQDGNIAEAVVWEVGPAERHTVVHKIVQYALHRHLPAGSTVSSQAGCLDFVLQSRHAEANAQIQSSRLLDATIDRLSKQIRGLTNLTLNITSTQPLSAVSRHTAPFYPLPHPLAGAGVAAGAGRIPRCLEPAELLLQLEGSGKWADDPEAFRRMKAALGVQLAQALESSFGLDAEASEDYVDVLTNGFAIRLFLFSNRDEIMAARSDSESSQRSVSRLLRQRAQHHGLVTGIAGHNLAFSPAARLAVRWVAAHMMAGVHLPVEAVELVVAAAFLPGTAALSAPGSPIAGFARFLHLLSQHPWRDRPLVVDPSAQLTPAQHKRIQATFDAAKASGGGRGFTVCSPNDMEGSAWGQEGVSPAMRQRLVKLAGKSLDALKGHLERQHTVVPPAAIFLTPLTDFDALVVLREEALPYPDRAIPGSSQGLPTTSGANDDDEDGYSCHTKARARLHSIPKGKQQWCSC